MLQRSRFTDTFETPNWKYIRTRSFACRNFLTCFNEITQCKEELPKMESRLAILYEEKERFQKDPSFQSRILTRTSMATFELDITHSHQCLLYCTTVVYNTDIILKKKAVNTITNQNIFIHQKRNMIFGTHPRLGCNSLFQLLDEDTIKIIASFLEPNITDEFNGRPESECHKWLEYARERKLIK